MHRKPIWFLVADAGTGKIFAGNRVLSEFAAVPFDDLKSLLPPEDERDDDRPGRVYESANSGRHAVEPRTSPRRAEKQDAAQAIADFLLRKLQENAFSELVLIVPPRLLGDLHEVLPQEVRAKIVGEIGKDLTHLTTDQVRQHLQDQKDWFHSPGA